MTRLYAEGTSVSPEKSQAEISETLRRYGASGFAYGWEDQRAVVAFKAHERQIRFELALPDPKDAAFRHTPKGRRRDLAGARAAYEAEVRRRWRALALAIKAKLEVVETGIASFEDEFLAHIVLPDGATVGDRIQPEIASAYELATAPRMLLALGGGR